MQRLSTTDAAFLYTESVSGPMHISSVIVVDGELEFDTVFNHFEARIHRVPSYRRKLAQTPLNVAHPAWVDDPDFDLRNHVMHRRVPEGSSLQDGIDEAIRLNEPMLDRDRPLWAVYVVTGVKDRTLLLQATHHAMIDGASGVELMAIIFDFDKDYDPGEADKSWQPERQPTAVDLFNTAMTENIAKLQRTDWSRFLPQFGGDDGDSQKLLGRAWQVVSSFLSKPAITAPFNAGIVGPNRRLRHMMAPFGEIREVRRALGGTINDVVLTVVSEGIARYLADHGEHADDGMMRIMCPVNVRTEDKKGALGNQVSAIFPMLPARSMAVSQRLTTVISETERIKSGQEAQALTLVQESAPEPWPVALWPAQLVGGPLDPTALAARMPAPKLPDSIRPPNPGLNFVCTNVPGAQVPQYLCGHEVLEQIGVLILAGNMGLGVTILSYNKQLVCSFISDPNLLPDVERIVGHCEDAFQELLTEARERMSQLSA